MRFLLRTAKNLVKPAVPTTPFRIYGRGAIMWYHGTITVGSLFAVNLSDPVRICSLPFVCGLSTIGSTLGMQLFYFIPTIHLFYITFTMSLKKTWSVTGLELVYGPIGTEMELESDPIHLDESGNVQHENTEHRTDWDEFASDQSNDIRKMRKDLWDKILKRRETNNT